MSAPTVSAVPLARPNGWWGMLLVIATEATLFVLLLATYFYLHFNTPGTWPPEGIADPKVVKPLIATLILIASSPAIAVATLGATHGHRYRLRIGLLAATLLGIGFLVFQDYLVRQSLDHFQPSTNAYGSIFYVLIGLHAVHVAVGILLAAWAFLRTWTVDLDRRHHLTVQVTALYWHFVNVVAVLIFLTLYLSPRA